MAEQGRKRRRKAKGQDGGSSPAPDDPPLRASTARRQRPLWLRGWAGVGVVAAAALAVGYVVYAAYVTISDGTYLEVDLVVARDADGGLRLVCGPASTPESCATDDAGNPVIRAEARDRIRLTLQVEQPGNATHRLRLDGAAYALWPAGFDLTAHGCKPAPAPCDQESFTAWSRGTFAILATTDGVDDPSLRATLAVA